MAYNESAKKATMKYMAENLEEIRFRVRKGKKDEYQKRAEQKGMSLRAYIIDLIEKDMGN